MGIRNVISNLRIDMALPVFNRFPARADGLGLHSGPQNLSQCHHSPLQNKGSHGIIQVVQTAAIDTECDLPKLALCKHRTEPITSFPLFSIFFDRLQDLNPVTF